MARGKTFKVQKAKATYTERVLGAMTQIQKEHRKHSIHLATLRAQIRKNADLKNDTMGPQWSQWVGKAIHKLTDEGVIEHPHPQEVALTPQGKQLILSTKKTVPDDDDNLWHKVSTTLSRGRKRRRSSIGTNQNASSASATSKRAKRSNGTTTLGPTSVTPTRPRKSLPGPTVAFRDVSPLTDMSDDDDEAHQEAAENTILKAQLQGKDTEIEELRNRLEALTQRQHTVPTSSRYATPDHAAPNAATRTIAHQAVGKGIARTQSGSIIPNISKQPTPAPTDSGDDEYMGTQTPPAEMESFVGGVGDAEAWPTPASTRHRDLTFPMESPNDISSQHQQAQGAGASPSDGVSAGRVEDLERRLIEAETAISDLDILKADLEGQNSTLQEEVAVIQARLVEETASRELAQSEVQAKADDLSALTQSLRAIQMDKDNLQVQLRQAEDTVTSLTSQHDEAIRVVEVLRAELAVAAGRIDAAIAQKEADLAAAKRDIELCHTQINQFETSAAKLQHEIGLGQRQSSELTDRLKERETQSKVLETELQRVKESSAGLVESLQETQAKAAGMEAALVEARQLVSERDAALVRITEKLEETQASNVQLEMEMQSVQAALATSEGLVESLREELKLKDNCVQGLSVKLADAEQRVATAEELRLVSEKRDGEAQQELNRKISMLELTIASDRTEIEGLGSKLGEMEMQLEEERGALVGAKAEELRVRMELESEKRRFGLLKDEHDKAQSKIMPLEKKVADLNAEVMRVSNDCEKAKTILEELEQSQFVTLHDARQKMASIRKEGPTTVNDSTVSRQALVAH